MTICTEARDLQHTRIYSIIRHEILELASYNNLAQHKKRVALFSKSPHPTIPDVVVISPNMDREKGLISRVFDGNPILKLLSLDSLGT